MPDGCMEMIFHYGDLYRQFLEDGSFILQPRSFVFGQITIPLEIIPTARTGILAARFQPEGFAPFISTDLTKMKNSAVSLIELFGKAGRQFEHQVLSAQHNEERVGVIENFLLHRLNTHEAIDSISKSSVAVLQKLKGQLSVDELAGITGVSKRQLERKFSSTIGLSPKQLAKVIRLQATLKMLEQKQFTSLTALAYENGYFDQAHFIKDFKEFTGMSPKQFYSDNLKMSVVFIGME